MIKKYSKLILLLIIVAASILRLYKLTTYPALNADEAAIGYNAYSLLETGKDEHGNPWPIHFQSFNDYKPGLYFYMVLPFVKFLGLNELAVRLPATLLGIASIYVIYLLVKELFSKERLALIAALFLAISPWHIHFSRGGWEVNVATFLILLGVYLFIRATSTKLRKFYIFSAIAFVASLYAYHAARVIVPLFGLGIKLIYSKKVKQHAKDILVAAVIGALLLAPLVVDLTQGSVLSRAAGVGLFADHGPINRINEQRGQHESFLSFPARIYHNKAVNYGLAFLQNWAEHYSVEFLFLSGDDIERNKVPETGQAYLYDILLVLVGLFAIATVKKGTKEQKGWKLFLWWLLIAPSAAALTFQSPHALRAQNMAIPLTVMAAFGLETILVWLENKKTQKILGKVGVVTLGLLIVWNFARYQHMYWVHMAKEYKFSSQYGVKELVEFTSSVEDDYEGVVVTHRYDQPYILYLFYLKYPPAEFQKDHSLTPRDEFGFSTVIHFDDYYFVEIDNWDRIRESYRNMVIAGTDEEISDLANVVKKIYGTNGHLYFKVVIN